MERVLARAPNGMYLEIVTPVHVVHIAVHLHKCSMFGPFQAHLDLKGGIDEALCSEAYTYSSILTSI
jgi:hypothetical protein